MGNSLWSFMVSFNAMQSVGRGLDHSPPSSLLPNPIFPSKLLTNLHRQLKAARNLPLKNTPRIVLLRRGPQTHHILLSVARYGILGLVRIIQVYELVQQAHVPGRFVHFLHDRLRRLLHERVGGGGGPEGAEEEYCEHCVFSAARFQVWECWVFAGVVWDGYLLTPLPSAGVVPSELPPFDGPNFVTCVGKGSKARLHSTPFGTWAWVA